MSILHETVIHEPDRDYPLHLTAKRYWTRASDAHRHDPDALTLIFLHSTSFHKETWQPTIEDLFSLAASKTRGAKIGEAWAVECPNHGASVELNEVALRLPEFFDNCQFRSDKFFGGCRTNRDLISYLREVRDRRASVFERRADGRSQG